MIRRGKAGKAPGSLSSLVNDNFGVLRSRKPSSPCSPFRLYIDGMDGCDLSGKSRKKKIVADSSSIWWVMRI